MIVNGIYPFHNIVAAERIGRGSAERFIAKEVGAPVERVKRARRAREAAARVLRALAARLTPAAPGPHIEHRPLSVGHRP